MVNDLVEDWFAAEIGVSFRDLHADRKLGMPTVHLEITYLKPCELGEEVVMSLCLNKIGRSSVHASIVSAVSHEKRFQAELVMVCADLKSRKSVELPTDIRGAMQRFLAI